MGSSSLYQVGWSVTKFIKIHLARCTFISVDFMTRAGINAQSAGCTTRQRSESVWIYYYSSGNRKSPWLPPLLVGSDLKRCIIATGVQGTLSRHQHFDASSRSDTH